MVAISFPASPSVNDTFTSNGKTWQWNGTFWSLVVSGASVADGSVSTAKIADSAITAAKIADGTVVAAEIASDAITTAKILDANVTTAKIASSAITAAKIASDAVTTAKILDANVTTAKVAANAITQAKLASNLSAVTVTTTANRDTDIPSPFTGQLIVLTDTKKVQLWDGTAWLNITMAPPETPTSLSAIESTTSVVISFTAGAANGSAITNYKYALSTDGGSTYGSFTALSPADFTTPITVSGLSMNTTYHVKLKAVNDLGDSVASAAVTFTTEGVPATPTSLSTSNITGDSVDIAFTAGAANGASISNYKYAVSTDNVTYSAYSALSPADFTTPVTVSGLTSATLQYIKLKAVNSNGDSAASAAVSFTTLATPNAPTSLSATPASTSVAISFTPGAQGGSAISNYQYALSTNGGSTYGSFTALAIPDATSPITVDGLTANTAYYIKLKAVNTDGVGTASSAVSFTTLVAISYAILGGGGGGGTGVGGGGGAGGLLYEDALGGSIALSTSYAISIGGGGGTCTQGGNTTALGLTAFGGGTGGGQSCGSGGSGGCGGGGGGYGWNSAGAGTAGQGNRGYNGSGDHGGYGGGTSNAKNSDGQTSNNGAQNVTLSGINFGSFGSGGTPAPSMTYGAVCGNQASQSGNGGCGSWAYGSGAGSSGGSGIVILVYPSAYTITVGAGLGASDTNTVSGSYKYTKITSGTGNVSWA